MRHSPRLLLIASLLLLAGPAFPQEEAAWRGKVDVLVDRWSNDVGRARVERALTILDEHLARPRNRQDGEALLAKARLLLARPRPNQGDQHAVVTQQVLDYQRAAKTADLAAEALQDERRQQALALGCLASQHRLRAELSRLELIPGSSKREKLMQERGDEFARRRQQLEKAVGDAKKATQLLAVELQRVLTLREIDRLGNFPRPIGQDDIDGQPVDLTTYNGKVLLILFWSSKLGDRKLLEEIAALQSELKFEVLAVNLDEKREDMDAAVADLGVSWRHCFDGKGITGSVARAWSVRALPTGVLVDRSGRVRYVDPWRGSLRLAVEELSSRD